MSENNAFRRSLDIESAVAKQVGAHGMPMVLRELSIIIDEMVRMGASGAQFMGLAQCLAEARGKSLPEARASSPAGSAYDDTALRKRVAALESRPAPRCSCATLDMQAHIDEASALRARVEALEGAKVAPEIHPETRAFVISQQSEGQSFEQAHEQICAKLGSLRNALMRGVITDEERKTMQRLELKLSPSSAGSV